MNLKSMLSTAVFLQVITHVALAGGLFTFVAVCFAVERSGIKHSVSNYISQKCPDMVKEYVSYITSFQNA